MSEIKNNKCLSMTSPSNKIHIYVLYAYVFISFQDISSNQRIKESQEKKNKRRVIRFLSSSFDPLMLHQLPKTESSESRSDSLLSASLIGNSRSSGGIKIKKNGGEIGLRLKRRARKNYGTIFQHKRGGWFSLWRHLSIVREIKWYMRLAGKLT